MSHDQDGGWRDALWNCRFRDDSFSHIFEIQLHHKAMLVVRKGLGGHATYAQFRGLLESLEVAQQDLEPKDTVSLLQARVTDLEAKKTHAKNNKLYAEAKLYRKELEAAKATLEKVKVTRRGGLRTLRRTCCCVCCFLLFFVVVVAVRRKRCSLRCKKLWEIPITKSACDSKPNSKCSCR